jgi:predicted GIY-YIG superfamily endonuclease
MNKKIPSFEEIESRLVYGCGFPRFRSVDGRTSIQHIVQGSVSGIYVLYHKDGTFYIGLSVDVRKRFEQHVVEKRPIAKYTFRKVHKLLLDQTETETISILREMGARITNSEKMSSGRDNESKMDVLTSAEIEKWLKNDTWNDLSGRAPSAPNPDSNYEEKYRDNFLFRPYAEDIINFYAEYVKKCIIKPSKTVPEKWNVTCLPNKTYEVGKCISTLNVGGQASVLIAEKNKHIYVHFSVKKTVFKRTHPDGLTRLKLLSPSIIEKKDHMNALGDDQLDFVVPLDEAKKILRDRGLILSIRALVVHRRGMTMAGSSMYKRFHCYTLGSEILSRM